MQTTPGHAPEGSDGRGQDKPTVSYWHVWTDENGVSHQTRLQLSAFQSRSLSPGAAPEWMDQLITSGGTVLVVVQPVGWVGEWHEDPKPQWIVPLSGHWFVETMDGTRVEMGPGEASFGNDQHCKPDAQGRKGHRSGTVGNQPAVMLIIQLEQDPGRRPTRPLQVICLRTAFDPSGRARQAGQAPEPRPGPSTAAALVRG